MTRDVDPLTPLTPCSGSENNANQPETARFLTPSPRGQQGQQGQRVNGVSFFCAGAPATQGSKRGFVVNGRVVMAESSGERLKDWRHVLAVAARDAWPGPPTTGPVAIQLYFHIPKPASAPKRKRTWPIKARSGDLDKLARAVLDAITHVVVADDAQVVHLNVVKDWAQPEVDLGPGVRVGIWEVDE